LFAPFFLCAGRNICAFEIMTKYILITAFIAALIFAFWFKSWTGPQQLNFVDRIYPAASEGEYSAKTGIAFGEDERQKLDVYSPSGTAKGRESHPVLVFFHGGSWRDGERGGYAFLGRTFAAKGFVTVIADYRKIPKHRFPTFVEDAADAIAWSAKNAAQYKGDPARIFVMGHSAGAHIAMMAVLDPQWLARNGLNSGIIKGVVGLAGPYDFLPFDGPASKEALGHWPRPAETQPISYVRADAPPLLLLTGDIDDTVKPRNSTALAAAMTDVDGVASVKTYAGVDHYGIIMAVARPFRSKAPVVDDVTRFIRGN
jgi:acetyl esterase/lipase